MIQRMRRILTHAGSEKGFTLIEMAIVLIIIGIIIGAVVKGKDVIKSAEQKRIYNSFIREWQVAYNNYYDRTGWILGDNTDGTNSTPRDGRCGNGGTPATGTNLVAQLTNVGLTPPALGPTGASNVRTYTDSNGRQFTLTLVFDYNTNLGNFIRLNGPNGVPVELGLALDRIVDSTADGRTGDLQYDNDANPAATQRNWPAVTNVNVNSQIYLPLDF